MRPEGSEDPRERRIQELEKQVQRRCQHSFQHHRLESVNEPGKELPPALHLGQLLFSQPPFEQRLCQQIDCWTLSNSYSLSADIEWNR